MKPDKIMCTYGRFRVSRIIRIGGPKSYRLQVVERTYGAGSRWVTMEYYDYYRNARGFAKALCSAMRELK